jgi:hypothetical protein
VVGAAEGCDLANLDDGTMWPTSYAVTDLTDLT